MRLRCVFCLLHLYNICTLRQVPKSTEIHFSVLRSIQNSSFWVHGLAPTRHYYLHARRCYHHARHCLLNFRSIEYQALLKVVLPIHRHHFIDNTKIINKLT